MFTPPPIRVMGARLRARLAPDQGGAAYPGQFWLMFAGLLMMAGSASMVGPFLMLYMSERLRLPLSVTASALIAAAAGELLSAFLAGPLVDRLGRRFGMLLGLFTVSGVYLGLGGARTFAAFTALVTLQGLAVPFYRIGADAMVADLIPEARRPAAYALLRLSDNLGFALGPVLGGLLASLSSSLAFYAAALGMGSYGLLVLFGARETLLPHPAGQPRTSSRQAYQRIFRDRHFLVFNGAVLLFQICATTLWALLAVYTKANYGISTALYGWIPATNGAMVVVFQVGVTRLSSRFPPLRVIALGGLIYASAVLSVALGTRFEHFWLSFAVMTVGELLLVPTASAYVAGLAPAEMRGRYLSLFSLVQGAGRGVAPSLGGLLNDHLGPQAIWLGSGLSGLLGTLVFSLMAWRAARRSPWSGGRRAAGGPPSA